MHRPLRFLLALAFVGECSASTLAAQWARRAGGVHDAESYYTRALAEMRAGDDDAAISDLERTIALDPDRFEAYDALDDVLSKHRQWATAVRYWARYIQRHPDDGRAYCEQGGAYSWLHDTAHMRADAEKACSLGDQQCCQIISKFRARRAPSPAASSREPLPRIIWALLAMMLCFPVLVVIYFILGPKLSSPLDLFLKSAGFSGAALCILYFILYFIHVVKEVPLVPLFCAMTPAAMGAILYAKGLSIYREFRVVLDTPGSPIEGLAMGFVEVHGKATGAETVPSPVGKTPCFFYKVVLEGTWLDHGHSGDFCKVDLGGTPFYLQDATGKVRVDLTGAEYDLLLNKEARFKLSGWRKINVEADELIRYADFLTPEWQDIPECHFSEYCVLPGHWYDLAGTCVENPEPQDNEDRNMIVKGREEPTFLISWRSEKGIKAWVHRRAARDIYVGGALILLGAAIGLAIVGLV